MQRLPEPPNPWGLLCTWPAWRGLHDLLRDLEQILRTIGADASYLADAMAAVLTDPISARADLPDGYRLRAVLQKAERRQADDLDLESECLTWISEVARYAVDVPVLLEAAGAADALGPVLTADLPRSLQARFSQVALRLRQMVQGRRLKEALPAPDPAELSSGLGRFVVPQPDGFAIVLPRNASEEAYLAAWRELALRMLERQGLDVVRLHLQLLAARAAGAPAVERQAVYTALGLRQSDRQGPAERCYEAVRQLRRMRLSLYLWELDDGALSLEHQAQDLWALRLQEGGQAHLVEEGGALITRGREWSLAPDHLSWIASMPEAIRGALGHLAHALLYEVEGARNHLSLALGLILSQGVPREVTNEEILRLAGQGLEPERALWQRLRAAARLQRHLGWFADHSGWPRRFGPEEIGPDDWARFLRTVTPFSPPETD